MPKPVIVVLITAIILLGLFYSFSISSWNMIINPNANPMIQSRRKDLCISPQATAITKNKITARAFMEEDLI